MAKQLVSAEATAAAQRAAERLHHLSMRYAGAVFELANGRGVAFVPQGHPGLSEMRDLFDLVLLCRAEINGLVHCLSDAGVLDAETYTRQMAEQYEWLAQQKAQQFGCEVTDYGLQYTRPNPERN